MTRIPQLDGLRALAFLAVYLNHALNVPFLWVGVDLFFVLSGFLITGLLLREAGEFDLRRLLRFFYTRRAFRIVIPYAVLMLLVTVFVESKWVALWPYYVFFSQNIVVALYPDTAGTLGPLWSLGVEEQFYLMWPIIVFACLRRGLVGLCWMLVAVAFVLRAIAASWAPSYLVTFTLMPFRMDLLAAGALIAIAARRGGLARLRVAATISAGASGACFLVLAITHVSFRAKANSLLFNTVGYTLILIGCVSVLLIALTTKSGTIHRVLMLSPMRYIGRISFMCYMAHAPILKLLNGSAGVLHATICLAAVILFSSLTWYAFEERCIRMGRRITSRSGCAVRTGPAIVETPS